MSRKYEVSHDGKTWATVDRVAFCSLAWPHRRDSEVVPEEPAKPVTESSNAELRERIARLERHNEALLVDVKNSDADSLRLVDDIKRLERERDQAATRRDDWKGRCEEALDELAKAKAANGSGLAAIRKLRRIREYLEKDTWLDGDPA
jgi:hypothetical protein